MCYVRYAMSWCPIEDHSFCLQICVPTVKAALEPYSEVPMDHHLLLRPSKVNAPPVELLRFWQDTVCYVCDARSCCQIEDLFADLCPYGQGSLVILF